MEEFTLTGFRVLFAQDRSRLPTFRPALFRPLRHCPAPPSPPHFPLSSLRLFARLFPFPPPILSLVTVRVGSRRVFSRMGPKIQHMPGTSLALAALVASMLLPESRMSGQPLPCKSLLDAPPPPQPCTSHSLSTSI